jgi:YbgC/YbaW family acyl-CoA thioester hydrolase
MTRRPGLFGNNRAMTHQLAVKPRFGELDPYNHVNHAVYVAWFEAARCEALDSIGLGLHELAGRGYQVVVAELTVRYRSPVRAGIDVVVSTEVTEVRGASSTWVQRVHSPRPDSGGAAGPIVYCEAELRVGFCDSAGKPTRTPAEIREALASI